MDALAALDAAGSRLVVCTNKWEGLSRKLLSELGIEVLRLIRVSIGSLTLGTLPKGEWRMLSSSEVRSLA